MMVGPGPVSTNTSVFFPYQNFPILRKNECHSFQSACPDVSFHFNLRMKDTWRRTKKKKSRLAWLTWFLIGLFLLEHSFAPKKTFVPFTFNASLCKFELLKKGALESFHTCLRKWKSFLPFAHRKFLAFFTSSKWMKKLSLSWLLRKTLRIMLKKQSMKDFTFKNEVSKNFFLLSLSSWPRNCKA